MGNILGPYEERAEFGGGGVMPHPFKKGGNSRRAKWNAPGQKKKRARATQAPIERAMPLPYAPGYQLAEPQPRQYQRKRKGT